MIGAVTKGLDSTQASATTAGLVPELLRRLDHALADRLVLARAEAERHAERIGAAAHRRGLGADPGAREIAARHRRPRDDRDPFERAERHHLALLLAIDEVVVVLHRDEFRMTPGAGDVDHARELPGVHRRGADIERLAGA